MCLGIPMQVESISGFVARCTAKGVARDVNLFMLQHEDIAVGDYLVVHLGNAIERIDAAAAAAAWEIYDAMLAATDGVGTADAGAARV